MQLIRETLQTKGGQAILELLKSKRDWLKDISNIPRIPGHIGELTLGHQLAEEKLTELIDELENDHEENKEEDYGANP